MTTKEIIANVQKIKELEIKTKALQEEIDALKQSIKDEMIKYETEELVVGIYTIRYIDVNSNKFNQAAFKKENEKLYESYCTPSTSKRFTIT